MNWRANQRTSRAEYWWYVTVMAVAIGIVCVVVPSEMRALIIIPLVVSLMPATARRFHDTNYHCRPYLILLVILMVSLPVLALSGWMFLSIIFGGRGLMFDISAILAKLLFVWPVAVVAYVVRILFILTRPSYAGENEWLKS